MAYTDFIAAIDLGSSHMVGMVGTKSPSGALSIIAHEVEDSATCIRRGCVYNVNETANSVGRLVRKLGNRLGGAEIAKVYVGIGGQSLRSVDHTVTRVLGPDGVVTDDIIRSMDEECRSYRPDLLDVLEVVPPTYVLDDKTETNPVGVSCTRIEARYKLIVGRPSLRRHVKDAVTGRARMEIAGIIVSPLALADVVLTEGEKNLGCALIDFGAGVTTLTVYKGGRMVDLSVIPFGGNLITRDITSLHIVEAEAERVKLTYGSAKVESDGNRSVSVSSANGMGMREIKLTDLECVIEARVKEILENVYARLEASCMMDSLGAGIVITGGAAALKNLPEVIRERFKMDVRYSDVSKGVVESGDRTCCKAEYAVAVGLLKKGTENCARIVQHGEPETKVKTEEPGKTEKPTGTPPQKKPKGGLFGKSWKNKIEDWGETLFNDREL